MQGTRDVPLPSRIPLTTIVQAQQRDEECRKMAEIGTQPRDTWPPNLRRSALTFVRVCDILCVRIANGKPRIVLPLELRDHAIRAHHLSYYGGHFGLHKTRARLAERYWWSSLRRDVKMFMRKCVLCMAHTHDPRRWKWLSLPIGTPFELVAMDLYRPLTATETGNAYILVFIDHHTRWVELVPLKQPTASTVADAFFASWISRWGVPRAILSDNGPQFTAELLRHLCHVYGIAKLTAAPYHPRGNSIVEAYMRSLKSTLRLCTRVFRRAWDVVLPPAALAYRATPHSITGHSPYFLVTGQDVALPLSRVWEEPILHPSGARWLHALWRCRLTVLNAHARIKDENARQCAADSNKLQPGMHVALKLNERDRAAAGGKFAPKYKGPYIVTRVLDNGVTADLYDPVTGTNLRANRVRLEFLDFPPSEAPEEPSLPVVTLR
ncbi:hypothetical protein Emed_005750 [Eimeria media]